MKRIIVLLLSAVSLQLSAFGQGPFTPPGAPAPTMKSLSQIEPRTPISSLPVTITAAGAYYLTTNLTCAACTNGLDAITLNVSNVTVDLNGFELVGAAGSGSGVKGSATARNVSIKNGTTRGWGYAGINLGSVSFCALNEVRALQNASYGLVVGSQSVVQACMANGGNAGGIRVGDASTVLNCLAQNSNSSGISAGVGSVVKDCVANSNDTGINMDGSGLVKNCVANNNYDGLYGQRDTTFEGCSCMFNSYAGIEAWERCRISGNVFAQNTYAGIVLRYFGACVDGNTVINNNLNAFGFYGGIVCINVSHNLIIRNQASGNGLADYNIGGGTNAVGDIINVFSATAFITTSNPWANFSY